MMDFSAPCLLLVLLLYAANPVECLTVNVDNCIETVTVTEDLETVLASPGTLCLHCDFGSGASIDTTFQIDSNAVDDRVGSTVNGMLVVYDTEKVFDSRTPRNVKCSNGGSSFNAATFLWKGETKNLKKLIHEKVKRQMSVPGIPTNLMAIEQTNISLFITWTIPDFDGGSPLTDFRVRITNQRTFVIETRFTDRVVNEYNITDLDPFTTYTIAVAAINTNGRGDPAIIEADTLSERLDVISARLITRTPTTIRLRWRHPNRDVTTTAPVLRYQLKYVVNNGEEMVTIDILPENYNGNTFYNVDYTLRGLESNTRYDLTIVAFNIVGAGTAFIVPRIVTPTRPPTVPRNFMAMSISSFSVQLTWIEPEDDGGAPISRYTIEFITPSRSPIELGGDVRSYLFSLTPDTSFEVTLKATNDRRDSPAVTAQGMTPPQQQPKVPTPLTISDVTNTSAVVSWTLPDGIPTMFDLRYRKSTDDESSEAICIINDVTVLSKSLDGLEPLTSYTVRIRAGNSVGNSDFSTQVTFSTYGMIEIQATPQITVTVGDVENVVLQCTLQGVEAGDNINYVWMREGDSLPANTEISGGTLTFSNLLPEITGEYICTAQQVVGSIHLTVVADVPGRVSNIQVEVNKERITLQWDAPPSNGADITSYAVTVFQDGQQVYSMMSQTTSVSVTRSQLQEEGAAIRTENTEYLVRIVAENEVGQGEEGSETFVIPAESAAPPELSCSFSEVAIVTLMVDCQLVDILDVSTTCSYDGLPAETCSLSFLLRYLDFEPGDHTLFLAVTATDGQADNVTVSFTTPLRLSATCSIITSLLTCNSNTNIDSQTCSFDGMPQIDCASPFDIRPLNLEQSEHSVTIFITDIFGQTDQSSFSFSTIPTQPITLSFTDRLSLFEGTDSRNPSLFNIGGQAVGDIPFSVKFLTYQAFEEMPGPSLSSVFSVIPSAASTSDFDASFMASFTFLASLETVIISYNMSITVQDDDKLEGDEGFILYFEFDESQINPDDFRRLETGTRTILVTIKDNDALSVTCMREDDGRDLTITANCRASHDVVSSVCSIDGQQAVPCNFSIHTSTAILQPGQHSLTITVTSTDGQTASDTITFTRPPHLESNCIVSGTQLSCTSNNEVDSYYCLFDGTRGEECSATFKLESIGIQIGSHTVTVIIRDIFSQQIHRDISFTVVSDLQIECQELNQVVTIGGVDCQSVGGIGRVSFTCSFDNKPAEECGGFPIELNLFEFTAGKHTLQVVATDSAGQPSSHNYTFFGIPDVNLTCSFVDNTLFCENNNKLMSQLCAFDGQPAIECSFPLEIRLTGLRLGDHNVVISVSDEFGQTDNFSISFTFMLSPIQVLIPATASVIEGKLSSPIPFRLSGQALSDISFSLSPLTYSQFETQSGLLVKDLFPDRPPPANSSDFSTSAFNFNFDVMGEVVTEGYTYNAVLTDDTEDENVEGFILHFEFVESRLNPDDYSRLSQTTAATLVTIIDNDGLRLVCEQRPVSYITLSVSCNASMEVEVIACSYDMDTAETCLLQFSVDILDFDPGRHTVLVTVIDAGNRVAADTVTFTTPPLLNVNCSIDNNNILACNSNNPIATKICQFDGRSSMPCPSPFNIMDLGLPLGPHSLKVTITDVFERTLNVSLEFTVESDLMLICHEVIESPFERGIGCRTTGGIGVVSYACFYDGDSATDCTFPIVLNVFEFSPGNHSVLVEVTDSVGEVKVHLYSFTGRTLDYVITVDTNYLFVNEDGRIHERNTLAISEAGYSFGDVKLTVTPLTYSEYETITGQNVAEIFPRQPAEASESDFESEVFRFTFSAGLEVEAPKSIFGSFLPTDDSESESTEGFLLHVEIDKDSLDSRDVGRVSVQMGVVLVTIMDDGDDEEDEETILNLRLSQDEFVGLVAGIIVFILILVTLFLLLCVCLIVWKRRKSEGKGILRSRIRQSKSSQSSERRIFHAAR